MRGKGHAEDGATQQHDNWDMRQEPIDIIIKRAKQVGECLVYIGPKKGDGYGSVGAGELTHRVVWEFTYGPIPEGMCVLHRCDNPPCVRVSHLFLGTRKDNALDRKLKGRGSRGEQHALAIKRGKEAANKRPHHQQEAR